MKLSSFIGQRHAILVETSSAAAERVFSLLSNSFTEQQMLSLEDYIECFSTTNRTDYILDV